ncbi:nuclear transport factor 2 family protein [Salinibacterium sp. M195]|uniref:nuclear transport factor 2 family protein n=1 Tax=Salinibacterium sp. M195 TaxID=2583374 RepID=UPI002106B2AA|nr:nuclear transport factor 2 family protein [Salinibacterium sp. M195]
MTHETHSSAELHDFVVALYEGLGDRAAFDERLHPVVTVWESADPRLLRGIDQLDELRGPAAAENDRETPLPSVVPVDIVAENWGETGLIRYVLEVRPSIAEPLIDRVRVTDVLRKSDAGWKIVHHHAQDLGPEDSAEAGK